MKARRLNIDILQLSYGNHSYEFDIDSSFFKSFEDSLIEKGNLNVKLTLDKSETLLQANFVIDGYVELICDRSLEVFDYLVSANNQLIFKYGTEYSELTDEIITIPKDLPTLNFAQYVYEFIGLAIPMKKLHPRFIEEEEAMDNDAEGTLIYSTQKEGEEDEDDENNDHDTDPRWDLLNNIKKNLN